MINFFIINGIDTNATFADPGIFGFFPTPKLLMFFSILLSRLYPFCKAGIDFPAKKLSAFFFYFFYFRNGFRNYAFYTPKKWNTFTQPKFMP